jgi:hypothetical protein
VRGKKIRGREREREDGEMERYRRGEEGAVKTEKKRERAKRD